MSAYCARESFWSYSHSLCSAWRLELAAHCALPGCLRHVSPRCPPSCVAHALTLWYSVNWCRGELRTFHALCSVSRRISGPRRDEVTGEWRRLHNEELNDLYSSPNIVRVIKSRRMRWAGHVARMGEEKGAYRVLVGKPEGKRPLGDLGVDGWIILGWISRRWDVGMWTGLGWPRIGTVGGRLWVQ